MRERVQASIDRLGYIPSIAAQRMSGSRSYLILALNDRDRTIEAWRARQGSDWVDQMLLGGMLKCAEHGYRMLFELVDTHDDHVERELTATLAALQPDGVILTPPHSDNPKITAFLKSRRVPFARIGSKGQAGGIPLVMGDEDAARDATRRLIELGHERIGFIAGSAEYSLSEWRKTGWLNAMAEAGLPTANFCVRGDFSYDSGAAAARNLLSLDPRPTAIIASNDQMALATRDIAEEMGVAIPACLSLISFDNTPVTTFANPPLTAIDQPIAETVSQAVELLIAASRGEELPALPVVVPARLIERGSTGPALAG